MREVQEAVAVANKGFLDDVSFGRERRQLLIVEGEMLEEFGLAPGDVRENITLADLPLSGLRPGDRLRIGPTLLEVTGECTPCERMDELRPGLQREIRGRRGQMARVVQGGVVRVGDAASLQAVAEDPLTHPSVPGGAVHPTGSAG
jgi:MOSC domain-containing protein YiiM